MRRSGVFCKPNCKNIPRWDRIGRCKSVCGPSCNLIPPPLDVQIHSIAASGTSPVRAVVVKNGNHEEGVLSASVVPITIFESSQSLRSVKSSIMMCHTRHCNSFTIIMTRSSIPNAVTRMRTKSSCAGRSTATTNADASGIRSFAHIACIIIRDQLLSVLFLKSTKNCGKWFEAQTGQGGTEVSCRSD